jgi:hypothetical protein
VSSSEVRSGSCCGGGVTEVLCDLGPDGGVGTAVVAGEDVVAGDGGVRSTRSSRLRLGQASSSSSSLMASVTVRRITSGDSEATRIGS